jgi:hypothetical protein
MDKYMISCLKFFLVLVLSSLVCACDPATDCISFDGPEFSNDLLPSGQVSEEYYSEIGFFVNNNPLDSSYEYDLDFSGELPGGMYHSIDYDRRKFILEGTPQASGIYNFRVDIKVRDLSPDYSDIGEEILEDGDDLCYESNHKDFTLIIN